MKKSEYQRITAQIQRHIHDEEGHPQQVQYLNLKNHHISVVAHLNKLSNLKFIDLRNNLLTQMLGFDQCFNLEELYLTENNIRTIKRIDHLPQLKLLDLRGNRISQLSEASIAQNIPKNLTKLMLRCNQLFSFKNICKTTNKFEIIWLNENIFVKGYKETLEGILKKKQIILEDLWMD